MIALKTLGFPLSRIADLLHGKSADLGPRLVIQRGALQKVRQRAERGLAMLSTWTEAAPGPLRQRVLCHIVGKAEWRASSARFQPQVGRGASTAKGTVQATAS